jgi:NAD(P)-dependent dehydrogenase (short-subunit alcohol dehydrogenase family)
VGVVKTAIVTGASGGLGLACARQLAARPGFRVVLACRDAGRGAKAAATIAAHPESRTEVAVLDVGSLASVRRFAAGFEGGLDALVLNAGVQVVTGRTVTEDGFEETFAVNHLGQFLLANLLLPHMSPGGRIVFVSSDTHDPRNWTGMPAPLLASASELARGDDRPGESPGHAGRRRYSTSKLCNVLAAYEMQRRLDPDRGISVAAFDPGFMPSTGLARDYGPVVGSLVRYLLPAVALLKPNAHLVRTSARRLARLAVDPEFAACAGLYYSGGRSVPSSEASYGRDSARDLWAGSSSLTGLTA